LMATIRSPKVLGLGGWSIGQVAGIDIRIHWTWLFIFGLLTWSLAEGLFLNDYPAWSRAEGWIAGATTSLVLFGCVLLHELSHSLVARRRGIGVTSITLFIFGGVSGLEMEPRRPEDEFIIAAVGPATSFVLAAVFGLFGIFVHGGVGTALLYLAAINALLGAFNLLPGFPLDGGRLVRATAWKRGGDLLRATWIASTSGKVMAVLTMAAGGVAFILGGFLTGVWFLVIGWFLFSQAGAGYRSVLSRRVLRGLRVSDALTQEFALARPEMTLDAFVSRCARDYHHRYYPVLSNYRLVGLISLSDVEKFPRRDWLKTSVSEAMTPEDRLVTVAPSDELTKAASLMAEFELGQLPVVDRDRLVGFVTREGIVRLMDVQRDIQSLTGDLRVAGQDKAPEEVGRSI
jgi:Zn-dependent protease